MSKRHSTPKIDLEQQPPVTEKDLAALPPTIVRLNNEYVNTYPVIIYTDKPEVLKNKGIRVQSVSKEFVTALIRKEDLKTLYQLKTVKHIALPQYDKNN